MLRKSIIGLRQRIKISGERGSPWKTPRFIGKLDLDFGVVTLAES